MAGRAIAFALLLCVCVGADTSDSLAAVGLALPKPGQMRVLVSNLTGESPTVTLRGLSGKPVSIPILGAEATQELSINLPPYGIARIEWVVD